MLHWLHNLSECGRQRKRIVFRDGLRPCLEWPLVAMLLLLKGSTPGSDASRGEGAVRAVGHRQSVTAAAISHHHALSILTLLLQ